MQGRDDEAALDAAFDDLALAGEAGAEVPSDVAHQVPSEGDLDLADELDVVDLLDADRTGQAGPDSSTD